MTSAGAYLDTVDYKWQEYSNSRYHFSIQYPDNWRIFNNSGEKGSVINVYNYTSGERLKLPLKLHEDPEASYLAFFPEGFGVDRPVGDRIKLFEAGTDVTVSFDVDQDASVAYQLNDGNVWGYLLKPLISPPGWSDEGFIFIQIGMRAFNIKCFDASGKEKTLVHCNTMGGGDRLVRYGEVKRDQRQQVDRILGSLHFFRDKEKRPIDDLIRVEEPQADSQVSSTVKVRGRARGMWFFEGEFPVVLKGEDNKPLAQASARAKGNWMMEDWVTFEADLIFHVSRSQPATLIFKKSNASGMPEHDRSYTVPLFLVARQSQ
ncbi:hypothetical protein C900_02490 [Fulvivirga imtechensis AK7]|uniref:Bacterial spore germination immunoglobulin-like domain-containing protein n=2 Tax=Fulvivirga TaxID=396811 RepID=L8JRT4_9BACT|nr:hypothetical protein C900_02490 [Fulvivirga imtechensis AK7]